MKPRKTHSLKTWPSQWDAVASGAKTFEVRRHDRDFAVGDTLLLRKFDPERKGAFSDGEYVRDFNKPGVGSESPEELAETIEVVITYVMPGGRFGIDPDFCVLGIRKAK